MATVRIMTPEDIDAVSDLTARIFGDPDEYEITSDLLKSAYHECPFMPPDLCWVGEEAGRIVVKWQILDLEMLVAGVPIRMGRIQAVAAEPDANHKGYAKKVALAALPQIKDRGFDFVLGFAKRGAFYRRLGAVVVAAENEIEIEVAGIPRLREDIFRPWVEQDDLATVLQMYNQLQPMATGPLVRSTDLWPWLLRRTHAIWICPAGYIGIVESPGEMEVREVVGQGSAFHEAALRKLGALAREKGIRRIKAVLPPNHPLVNCMMTYGFEMQTIYSRKAGCIGLALAPVRLIGRLRDVMDSRLANSTHSNLSVELNLEGPDEIDQIRLNEGGQSLRKLNLKLSSGALLQLALGHLSIATLLEQDPSASLEPHDADTLDLLDTLFPIGHPFMPHADRY